MLSNRVINKWSAINLLLLLQAPFCTEAAIWQAVSATGFTSGDLVFGGSYFTDGEYQTNSDNQYQSTDKILTAEGSFPSTSLAFTATSYSQLRRDVGYGDTYKNWVLPPPEVDITNMRVNFSSLSITHWTEEGNGIIGWGVGSHNLAPEVFVNPAHCPPVQGGSCTPEYEVPAAPSTVWDWTAIIDNGDGTYTASWLTPNQPYYISFPTGGQQVSLTFRAAVPVPAAFWLFGSAFAGLLGICRKQFVSKKPKILVDHLSVVRLVCVYIFGGSRISPRQRMMGI